MASIVLTEDYPIHARLMRTYAREEATGKVSQRHQQWLTANQRLKRHILQELRRRGPLPARAFENKTKEGSGWYSSGWTSGRDVSQMLDYLWITGKIMVAGRLHIHAVHAEKHAPLDRRTGRAIEELAAFLGATDIHYTHVVPAGWQRELG